MTLYLNGTTGISGVDGTAGTPSLQGNDTNTGIVFGTDTVGVSTGGVQRTTVDSSGRLLVGVGSANANGGVLQLSGGITFPGTQVGASDVNTLDDYEEGTWTPTIIGTTVNGTTTYTRQDGIYAKVGRLVTVSAWVSATATTGSGSLTIGGLPFLSQAAYYSPGTLMAGLYNWSGGSYLTILVPPSAARCDIYASADDVAWQLQNITNEQQEFMLTITYQAT